MDYAKELSLFVTYYLEPDDAICALADLIGENGIEAVPHPAKGINHLVTALEEVIFNRIQRYGQSGLGEEWVESAMIPDLIAAKAFLLGAGITPESLLHEELYS